MIHQRAPDQITAWSLAFFTGHRYRFARLVPGRFKHVLAFGYSEPCRTWVVYDVAWLSTRIYVLPDGPWGVAALGEWLEGATIVTPVIRNFRRTGFAPMTCVSACAHLVGAGCGAWTPTGLYDCLIAEGAAVAHDGSQFSSLRSARAA